MANVYDISVEQGSSFNLTLTAKDSTGTPLNLSGYNARGGIKYGYGSTGYLLSLSPTINPSYVSGLINISLTSTQTSLLPVTKAVYDIEVYAANDYTFKAIRGYVDVVPEVTNL
jgi:hypothetical protein